MLAYAHVLMATYYAQNYALPMPTHNRITSDKANKLYVHSENTD